MNIKHTLLLCFAILIIGSIAYAGWTTFTSVRAKDDMAAGDDLTVGDDMAVGGDASITGALTAASLGIDTSQTLGGAAVSIKQDDADKPFLKFAGATAGDLSANISTLDGDGAVVGPKGKDQQGGWAFAKMLFVQIDNESTGYWIPAYKSDPVQ